MRTKYGRQHFDFLSDSFIIPEERDALIERMTVEPGSLWIVKPPGKNNGSGIFVIANPEDVPDTSESILVQKYITNPYLIRRTKFDLRIYVLVTGVDPLKVYIYDEDGFNQLIVFLHHLHPLLDQNLHYRLYIINQADSNKFNRAHAHECWLHRGAQGLPLGLLHLQLLLGFHCKAEH